MHLTADELKRLRAEARRTYAEYGRVRAQHRLNRSDAELRRRMSKLRARYEELERLLGEQEVAQQNGAPEPPLIDVSQFEPEPPQALRPGNYISLEPDEPWWPRALRFVGRARVVLSVVLLVAAIGTLALIGNRNLGFYLVPSSSMEPTLMVNDHLVAYSSSHYSRGDVVVVRDPDSPDGYLVKRLVGLPGDIVEVANGRLIVNGVGIQEPYLKEPIGYHLGPTPVGADEVFLLGDNRNYSDDSHIWKRGVPESAIVGSVRYIYGPAGRRGARVGHPEAFAGVR